MSTDDGTMQIRGLKVQVVRKAIKNLHLGVYPPHGRVRVAAPLAVSNDAVRLAVIGKLGWIARQRSRFQQQPRQSKRELVSGESHFLFGRRYRLRVVEAIGADLPGVRRTGGFLELAISRGASWSEREAMLDAWSRKQLREVISPLMTTWQARLGVEATDWRIRSMRTKWGTCTPRARRVWFNLELVKAPRTCIEYIVVHELAHLLVPRHDDRFQAIMDAHLAGWRGRKELLSTVPLHDVVWPC